MVNRSEITCEDLARREDLLRHPTLNGIDYIEVPKGEQKKIRVYFIKPEPPSLNLDEVKIEGGFRFRNIQVVDVGRKTDENSVPYLEVQVNQSGDFSTYILFIDSPGKVDIAFSRHPFSFKAGCPSDFDCHRELVCPSEPKKGRVIDYMAKDYASFRQALIDLIPTLVPDWKERHEASLGIALVELLSYVGDQLSYYQDAVANEAYLETARQRESVKRHARLIDYDIHNGVNSRAFVHLKIVKGTSGMIPPRTPILSRIATPLGSNLIPPHGPVIPHSLKTEAESAAEVVFQMVEDTLVHSGLNEIKIHTWGNRLCCIPQGATTLDLVGDLPLKDGDLLLFEEVKGPESGIPTEANPNHRQVVRLIEVDQKTEDPLQEDPETGVPPLKITQVTWHRADALTFPLCISTQLRDGTIVENVSVARGNVVLADHGRTIEEWHPADPRASLIAPGIKRDNIAYRFELEGGPITFHTPRQNDDEKAPVRDMLDVDPHKTRADVVLEFHEDGATRSWEVVPHLLESGPFDRHFVVETKNDGKTIIRFGDGEYGMKPPEGSHVKAIYRVGNGRAGSLGAESLVHVIQPSDPVQKNWPAIERVRNPLPSWGGIDPESIDQVKLLAPKAFHAKQFRSVTEEDYSSAAMEHHEVDRAVATFRWTGSWHTVFVTVDPTGHMDVSQELEKRVRSHLDRYKLAGYDIEIDQPEYVPLEIEINICMAPDHFPAHVKEALFEVLSNRELSDGRRGFFHPDNFTFGQPVYLSKLYRALDQVDGVDSAEVIQFKRLGKVENHELDEGYISMGRLEIGRLDNDPNYPENGILRLNMIGGK
ncbi:MAG TPA: putative baseplate assembly protein [Anaerolineae bacterium]|nr:putative baseplate assembly protein [Anaerolineae bacterium]